MRFKYKFSQPLYSILNKASEISKYHNKKITGKEEFLQALMHNKDSIAFKITEYIKENHNIDIVASNPVSNPIGYTPELMAAISKSKDYAIHNPNTIKSEHILKALVYSGAIDIDINLIEEAIDCIENKGYAANGNKTK